MIKEKRWILQPSDPRREKDISQALGVSPTLAHLLVVRGVETVNEARAFLSPIEGTVHDPAALPGMAEALDRIRLAVERKEKVLLHGDYDVDGTSATALLLPVLVGLGLSVHHYLPHRIDDGYGVSLRAVEAAAEAGIQLMITVDCGISAHRELDRARELGIETIVTDHHTPSDTLPEACAVVDPKIPGGGYPNPDLAGVGVAYKLALALAERFGTPRLSPGVEELVALGSIADAVTVLGENRTLIARGLEALKTTRRPGLLTLYQVARLAPDEIHSEAVAFALAPRLNAVGRMSDPDDALYLLLTEHEDRARRLAGIADDANRERKRVQAATMREIEKQLALEPDLAERPALVLWGSDWHRGVIGIVASKLWDRFQRPAFVISVDPSGIAYGSARSDGGIPITEILGACDDLLLVHGGHREAGGFRLPSERLEEFRDRAGEYVENHPQPSRAEPELIIDGELRLRDLDDHLMHDLALLEPHGSGNPLPAFLARGIQTKGEIRVVGSDHLRLTCYQGKHKFQGIAFRQARLAHEIDLSRIDIVLEPQWNTWKGQRNIELRITDIRPSESGPIHLNNRQREPAQQPDPAPGADWLVDLRDEGGPAPPSVQPDDVLLALVNPESPRGPLEEWLHSTWQRSNPVWLDSAVLAERIQPKEHSTFIAPFAHLKRLLDLLERPCHVVLWDFPPSQDVLPLLGRLCGDGEANAKLYLSCGLARYEWQQEVLAWEHPDRDLLARLYLAIRKIEYPSPIPMDVVADRVAAARLPAESLPAALTIFQELEFLSLDEEASAIALASAPRKRSLDESPAYRAAMRRREERESLARFLLEAPLEEIHSRLASTR